MLKGKVALITGSAKGIGKTIAIELAKQGCNIIINDIEPMMEEAAKIVEKIKKLNVGVIAFAADISKYEDVEKIIPIIQEKFKKVDIIVNNAGITKDRTLKKMTKEEWNAVINVNLTGIYNVTHIVLPLIPDGGRIINISSIVGQDGNFGQCNYSASKSGIIGFTKSLAKELGKHKITVNAIAPGFIKSKMTEKMPVIIREQILALIPMKEFGLPEDVANVVAFLASDKARYLSGVVLRIDGGLSL